MIEKRVQSTALITGPTSGIGEALARLFARRGHDLVLVARSVDRLEAQAAELAAAYGVHCHVIPMDLTRAAAAEEIFDQLRAKRITVDILVNNAGFTVFGEFATNDLKAELDMLAVNVVALTHLSKLFLRQLPAGTSGRILNISSTAAFQPGPLMAVYYATKAYVLSFSEALSSELAGKGVSVTALCPGATATAFAERGKADASRLFKNRKLMTAEQVAQIGYLALMRGQPLVIAGWMNTLMAFSTRFAPRWLLPHLVRYIHAPV